jgi:signal transduction histidine kinase
MRQYLNWKTYLVLIALFIVSTSLYYTNRLAADLAAQEKRNVEQVAEAIKANISNPNGDPFALGVVERTTVPLIIADESEQIIDFRNIDTSRSRDVDKLLQRKLDAFRDDHPPIIVDFGFGTNHIYYGDSYLLTQLRYYPYVQMGIIFLFLLVVLIALSSAHRSIQNQVWVGLSKETAHQLGTPLSSIEAWLELLKDQEGTSEAVTEMQKDLDRLKLVADRFSKVGSAPRLEEEDLVVRMQDMVAYMQKRAPHKVRISLQAGEDHMPILVSGPLFDWVVENLIRNALDAMDGTGSIDIRMNNQPHQIVIDVTDTGKGIPRHQIKNVFNPGFTTKKRGWGLGLSLSRRIIERYHDGSLYVKHSELGKGTTFRIILRR